MRTTLTPLPFQKARGPSSLYILAAACSTPVYEEGLAPELGTACGWARPGCV
jgi:hypothetical protein